MPLADLEDINIFLPEDKLSVDDARYVPYQLDAERIVRGYLSGHITPATMATWTTPTATPGLVRSITGRLVASFYYKMRYSEDATDVNEYSQSLYDDAMMYLKGIVDGSIVLEEVTETVGVALEAGDFYPDNTAPGPYFTLDSPL